jgi:phage tail-like protein
LATYGIDLYGTQLYGPPQGGPQFVADNFDAESTDYGAIEVSWLPPTGQYSRQRLLRSTIGPSYDENDGTILYDYTLAYPKSWHDSGLTGGVWYYYTLFVFVDTQNIWIAAGSAGALCVKNFGQTDRLYASLPNVYKSPDLQAIGNSVESTDTSLYRFLSITGFEHDRIRTELEALTQLKDPNLCPAQFLPAFAHEMGISFEPELGIRSVRRWLANAVHLFHIKGTALCARDLVAVLTGWSASVSIGKNLALNDPTAEQVGSAGLWRDQDGTDTHYKQNGTTVTGIVGDGVVETRITGAEGGIARVGLYNLLDRSRDQALTGIQVVQGRQYAISMFFKSSRSNIAVTMSVVWVDRDGNFLGTTSGDPVTINATDFTSRPFVTDAAPAGATFGLVYWTATGLTGHPLVFNDYIWSNGFQFELGSTPTDTVECARKLYITLRGDAYNSVLNGNGVLGTDGWDTSVGSETNTDTGVSDMFVTVPSGGETDIEAINGSSFTRVSIGDTFTLMAQGQDTVERGALMMVGLQRFAGSSFVDTVYGTPIAINTTLWSNATFEYSVPIGDAITHVVPVVHFRSHDDVDLLAEATVLKFRHVALIDLPESQATYFDGSTPSPTSDYVWEGTPNASRSWQYKNRSVRTSRLRAILPLYLVTNKCFDFIFAPPDVELFAPLVGVENYNRNPGMPPPPPAVSSDLDADWAVIAHGSRDLSVEWETKATTDATATVVWDDTVPVGAEVSPEWDDRITVGASSEEDFDEAAAVGADFSVVWDTLVNPAGPSAPTAVTVYGYDF